MWIIYISHWYDISYRKISGYSMNDQRHAILFYFFAIYYSHIYIPKAKHKLSLVLPCLPSSLSIRDDATQRYYCLYQCSYPINIWCQYSVVPHIVLSSTNIRSYIFHSCLLIQFLIPFFSYSHSLIQVHVFLSLFWFFSLRPSPWNPITNDLCVIPYSYGIIVGVKSNWNMK